MEYVNKLITSVLFGAFVKYWIMNSYILLSPELQWLTVTFGSCEISSERAVAGDNEKGVKTALLSAA